MCATPERQRTHCPNPETVLPPNSPYYMGRGQVKAFFLQATVHSPSMSKQLMGEHCFLLLSCPSDMSLSPQLPCLGLASQPWTTRPHSICASFTRSYGRWGAGEPAGLPSHPTPPFSLASLPLGSQHQDPWCSSLVAHCAFSSQ